MGPLLPLKNTADAIVWAHLSCLKMLPLILNGPAVATEKHCLCFCMSPFTLPKTVAHNIEWAHSGCLNQLLIMTNVPWWAQAPRDATEKYCRSSQMGPLMLMICAWSNLKGTLQIVSNVPSEDIRQC